MKAVVLRQPEQLEWADVPRPRLLAADHILIRVEACGICGSDLRYFRGENPWALHTLGHHLPNPPNLILGHEFAGVVVEVNSSAYEHLLGKRVGAQAFRVCGACEFCTAGAENLCRSTIHIGHAQGWGEMEYYPGAYAEYCPAWGDLVFPIPEHVLFEEAAMADVVCVAAHVVGRARPGGNVLCIGGGPVGLCIAQIARARGAERIFVLEPSPVAQRVLRCFDFITVLDPSVESPPAALARHDMRVVASIFDTIGSSETITGAARLLAERGTYVNVALHDTPVALSAAALGSEKVFTSSSNAVYEDVREAYRLIHDGMVNVRSMITHRFPLHEIGQGFDLLLRSPKEAFKVVLYPNKGVENKQ